MTATALLSKAVLVATGTLSKAFLSCCLKVQVEGLERFVDQIEFRKRGLITISNHISVLDDPLLWGVLPFRLLTNPKNVRWSLGAADICFTKGLFATYFSLGQTLPIERHGRGIFQPSIDKAVELVSSRCQSWVHVFPEGRVHQHPNHQLRYFKWGVSRLILEADELPMIVPIFHTGFDTVMHESRGFPRFLPRIGKEVKIQFGEPLAEDAFHETRSKYQSLMKERGLNGQNEQGAFGMRSETALLLRTTLNRIRSRQGYPDEDQGAHSAEFYQLEDFQKSGPIKTPDGSWEKDI